MLGRYNCSTNLDYENALKEIIQEIALLGLWRAKFFEHAAFYGGTALRIFYQLDRFSEDLDFSLLKSNANFSMNSYLNAAKIELESLGFEVIVEKKEKTNFTAIESAFLKANTKTQFLKIQAPANVVERTHRNAALNIKIEVDTDPPLGFKTEAKTLLQPIPFSVNIYQQPDLFAGKIHAILCRNWKTRVKGRDYYDFVWYIARGTPVRLSHLEQRFRQSGQWADERPLSQDIVVAWLDEKFSSLDIDAAKRDVSPFIIDKSSVELWSCDFFRGLLSRLRFL